MEGANALAGDITERNVQVTKLRDELSGIHMEAEGVRAILTAMAEAAAHGVYQDERGAFVLDEAMARIAERAEMADAALEQLLG